MLNTKCWIIQKYQIIQRAKCYLVNTVTIFSNWDAAKMGNKPQTTNAPTFKGSKKPQTRNISKKQCDVQVFIVFSLSLGCFRRLQVNLYSVPRCTKGYLYSVQFTLYHSVHTRRVETICCAMLFEQCVVCNVIYNIICNVIWTVLFAEKY